MRGADFALKERGLGVPGGCPRSGGTARVDARCGARALDQHEIPALPASWIERDSGSLRASGSPPVPISVGGGGLWVDPRSLARHCRSGSDNIPTDGARRAGWDRIPIGSGERHDPPAGRVPAGHCPGPRPTATRAQPQPATTRRGADATTRWPEAPGPRARPARTAPPPSSLRGNTGADKHCRRIIDPVGVWCPDSDVRRQSRRHRRTKSGRSSYFPRKKSGA